jgi:hypothetical protein
MARAGQNCIVPSTCGVGVSGIFRRSENVGIAWGQNLSNMENPGGAGWHIASFTGDLEHRKDFHEAYMDLKKRWQIVLQTEKRKNKRTDKMFILVVYDTLIPKNEVDNSEFKFPWVAPKVTA